MAVHLDTRFPEPGSRLAPDAHDHLVDRFGRQRGRDVARYDEAMVQTVGLCRGQVPSSLRLENPFCNFRSVRANDLNDTDTPLTSRSHDRSDRGFWRRWSGRGRHGKAVCRGLVVYPQFVRSNTIEPPARQVKTARLHTRTCCLTPDRSSDIVVLALLVTVPWGSPLTHRGRWRRADTQSGVSDSSQ